MVRNKNAKRKHEIAPFDPKNPTKVPDEGAWKRLARYITTIEDETDEETDDTGYYDGDGNPEETVLSVVGGYSFEGDYDAENEAQAMIAAMKYKTGEARRVWHRVTESDNKKTYTQVANVSGIKAGSGDATDYEEFACTLKWVKEPIEAGVGG